MPKIPLWQQGAPRGTGTVTAGGITSLSPDFLKNAGMSGNDDYNARFDDRLNRLKAGFGNANLIPPASTGLPAGSPAMPNPAAGAMPQAQTPNLPEFPYYPESDQNAPGYQANAVPTQMNDFSQWLNNIMGQQFPYGGGGGTGGQGGFGNLIPGPS